MLRRLWRRWRKRRLNLRWDEWYAFVLMDAPYGPFIGKALVTGIGPDGICVRIAFLDGSVRTLTYDKIYRATHLEGGMT